MRQDRCDGIYSESFSTESSPEHLICLVCVDLGNSEFPTVVEDDSLVFVAVSSILSPAHSKDSCNLGSLLVKIMTFVSSLFFWRQLI